MTVFSNNVYGLGSTAVVTPRVGAYDFLVTNPVLPPEFTFTRASQATFTDRLGRIQIAPNNMPRFDWDPITGAARGLLVEGARTNFVRNSEAQGGGVGVLPTNWFVNTSGGLTVTSVGNFVVNGLNVHRIQLSGTTTSTSASIRFETTTSTVAASGQTWTGSLYTRQFSGSQTNITSIDSEIQERDAAGAFLTSSAAGFAVGTLLVRGSHTRLLNNASTARITNSIRLNFSGVGVTVDITLDVAAPQLEQAAFASSYIPTTGTTATRAAERVEFTPLSNMRYNILQGTVFVEGEYPQQTPAGTLFAFSNNSITNLIGVRRAAGTPANVLYEVISGGVSQNNMNFVGIPTGVRRAAVSWDSTGFAGAITGVVLQTNTTPGTIPSVDRVHLGMRHNGASSDHLFGYIRRFAYTPNRLPDSFLTTMTT